MAHIAQRVMLGLAIATQAIFGGLPLSAQLSVPPPKIGLAAPEPLLPLTPAPSDLDKGVEAAPVAEAALSPAAPRTDSNIGLSLYFSDRRAPLGHVLTGTLSVTPPAAGDTDKTFDVAIDLPPGLDFVASGLKGVTYDPALRAVIMTGMDTGRASQHGRSFAVVVGDAAALSTLTPRVRVLTRADRQAFRIKSATLLVPGGGEKTRIDAKGGSVSVAGGAARLDFGPGALRAPQTIEASLAVSALPSVSAKRTDLAASDEEDNSAAQQPVWSITLSPDLTFDTPVTLTTNISGLVPLDLFAAHEAVLEMRYVYTAWVTRTTGTGEVFSRIEYQTEEMPVTLDEATGEVTARLWHFSTYDLALAQPAAPKPWTPSANASNVALFRGAAAYQQPLPALPSFGLEPKLAASYSSASAESNFLQTNEPGMKYQLGRGWSLEIPHIAQLVKRDFYLGNPAWDGWRSGFETEARGNFTLVMGGMSVGLKPTGANGEYVTDDSQALRIVRCAKASPCAAADQLPGITHSGADWDSGELEYWQVWTPDGTRYVFGSETSSRATVQDWDYNWCGGPGCGSGWNSKMIGMVWMLRRVYAPDRDTLSASVDRWGAEYQYTKTVETGSRCAMALETVAICGTQDDPRIRPIQIVYGNSLLGASERYTVTFGYSGDKVTEVTAYEPGNRPAERARLSYVWVPFYGVGDELSALTNEAYTGTAWVGLPATAFAATEVSNVYNGTAYGPDPKRLLSRVENGLGARWNFTYQPDTSGYHASFRVTSRSVVPAGAGAVSMESYVYKEACYNWPDQPCIDPSRSWAGGQNYTVMGYGQVTRTVMDEAGVPLTIEAHRFYTDAKRLGREFETRYRDGGGQVLSAKQSDIVTVTLSGYPVTTWQVRTTETREYPYGDIGSAPVKRTRTDAFTALGSPKTIQEYGFEAAGDERTTFIGYVKGPVAGEVPVWEALYSGIQTAESETPERLSSTRLYYDNAEAGRANSAWTGYSVYSQTLSRGRLTAVEHGLRTLGDQPAVWAMSTYGYDALGNLAVLTDAGLNVSSVNYDGSGQFVLGSQNALRQATSYAYYGVNGESLTNTLGAAQPYGALKSTTDPNGATVQYAYDALGRLRKVAQPGDTLADPSEEWHYYDEIETAWTTTATGFSAGPYLSDHLVRSVSGGGWTSATLAAMDRTVYDGLGRVIQTQTRAGQGWAWASCNDSPRKTLGAEVIQSTLYDALGRAVIQTVPYTQTQYEYCATAGRVNTPYVAVPQTQTIPSGMGLAAAYYNGTNFDTLILEKTDATINFNWYGGSPYPGIVNDNQFSARWTGYVRANTSETYTIYATGDDGIRLWVNGQLLVDQWHLQGPIEYSATMTFQAGVYYELRFDYFENNDGAEAYLKWASPTVSKRIIPTANLYRARPYVTALPPQTMPSGTGLTGAYFNGKSFETQVLERTDATINFNWYGGSPAQPIVHDNEFSAHWMGYVRADTSETYTIYVAADDGIRLWVNGQLRVDQWHNQGLTEYSTTVTFQAGGFYPIQFDYFENTDGAEAYLKWASPTVSKRIIPAANLYRIQPYIPATLTVPYARTDYDGLGRPITVTAPDGSMSVIRYGVDANGPGYAGTTLALKTMIDPNGHQTQQVSDGLGRLVRVREFTGTGGSLTLYGETRYAYDAGDRLTTVTDAAGNVTTIAYDGLGRKVGMVDPDMGAWTYGYNAQGQLITQTDALGQTLVFTYDSLGRMTGKGVGGASPSWLASYVYDQGNNGIGRRARMTDTTGYAAWAYDARGRVITATKQIVPNPVEYVTKFGYDDANRVITTSYPGGDVVTNTYDAAGQPYSLYAAGSALVTSAAYNALGAPTRVSFANGLDKINRYFGLDALAGQTASYGKLRNTCVINAGQACVESTATALFNTVYDYDNAGNVTVMTDVVKADRLNAAYDALNRLTSVTQDGALSTTLPVLNEAYTNDKIGNLTSKAGVTITAPATARYGFESYTVFSAAGQCYCFAYVPNTGAWVFSGAAGVSENGSCLTSGNPPTPQMTRTAFLQTGGRMAITVTGLTVSETYRIGFVMARRGNYNAHLGRTFTVTMGGQNLGVYSPMTTTWEQALTGAVVANAASLQLVLEAGAEPGNDSMALIDDVAVMPAHPHAARAMGNDNSYAYDANGNMTVRREMSGTETYVYTQTWSIDNRLIGVTKATVKGTVLAVTTYAYDGDGVRVRKDDPDGTTLYIGATEAVIGAPGTAAIEYYDDTQAGTFNFLNYTKTVVSATTGISYAWGVDPPLAGMGGAPWALRWNQWVSVAQAGLYTVTVIADDGVGLSIAGVSVIYSLAIRDTGPLTAGVGVNLTPGNLYQLQVSYLNYTSTNGASFRLRWTRPDGVSEDIPALAMRLRSRRDYFSFGGATVAMKEGVAKDARVLTYLHGDHLGSASLTTDASGQKMSEQRYKPYGEVRWVSGAGMPTDKQFTSQMRLSEGYVGTLYDYVARAYDPALGRFVSVDTVVPDMWDPQYLNRYAYVRNNPLLRGDPDGHCPICVTALIGAAVGAVIGAATVALPAMISNMQSGQPLMTNIDPAEVAKAAAVGGVAGLVAGATMGIGTAVLGTGFGATVATGAVSGVIAGQAGKATGNVIDGNEIGTGLFQPEDMIRDGALGALGAAGGYAIGKVAGRLTSAGTVCSFSPDTPVATDAGLIPIAGVITGTRVLAWDETSNATGYYPVTNVWVHWDPVLVVLIIDGEAITTTPEHPFYARMHGWLPAGELWVGAGLRRADGGAAIVESTMTMTRTELTWNLTVDVAHTFFVGGGEWLVHNACPNPGGINGNSTHRSAVAAMKDSLETKWGNGYDVEAGKSLSTYSGKQIPLNRKPDAAVIDRATGKVVEIGEAYRPLKTSTRPASSHELAKIPDYQQYGLPVLWWMVK